MRENWPKIKTIKGVMQHYRCFLMCDEGFTISSFYVLLFLILFSKSDESLILSRTDNENVSTKLTYPVMITFQDHSDPNPSENIQIKTQMRRSLSKRFRVPVCQRKYFKG